jgi:DNA primase
VYTINDVKEKIKLSDEIGKFVPLKRKGNSFWGRCPFHEEKTPSFSVNDQKNFFYCFGCGMGGDFFSFMQKYKNMSFKETIDMLAGKMGIQIKQFVGDSSENRILNILESAKDFYSSNINKCMDYLTERKITQASIAKFQIGFAPESSVLRFLVNKGFSIEEITSAGICSISKDRFRNRLIFPIKNRSGKTIAFGGRSMEGEDPKYLNSSETEIFKKSFNMFGQQFLEYNYPIIVVEGYLDVIALDQIGVKNVVAVMGTNLSSDNSFTLFKQSNKIFIMFDGDESGINAVEKNLTNILCTIQPDREVFICTLQKEDPYDAAQKGLKYVNNILQSSLPLSKWIKNVYLKSAKSAEEKARMLNQISQIIKKIKNPYVKEAYEEEFKNIKPKTIIVRDHFSDEDVLMAYIFSLWNVWDRIIEEISECQFENQKFESIRLFILEKIIGGSSPEDVNEEINKKWGKSISNLIKKTGVLYYQANEQSLLESFVGMIAKKYSRIVV